MRALPVEKRKEHLRFKFYVTHGLKLTLNSLKSSAVLNMFLINVDQIYIKKRKIANVYGKVLQRLHVLYFTVAYINIV